MKSLPVAKKKDLDRPEQKQERQQKKKKKKNNEIKTIYGN